MIFSQLLFLLSIALQAVSFSVIAFSPSLVHVPSCYGGPQAGSGIRKQGLASSSSSILLHASSTVASSASTSSSPPSLGGDDEEDKNDEEEPKPKSKGTTTLTFRGEKLFQSEPVPIIHTDPNDLSSFFSDDEVRSILLNGEREDSIEILPQSKVSDNMFHQWIKQSKIVGALPPSRQDDTVFKVNTGTMNFSGLRISSNSLVGAKYLEEFNKEQDLNINTNNNNNKPEYQLVFIKDSPVVQGPKFLVWIYNQLTGSNKAKKDDGSEKEQTIRAFSQFTYDVTPDGKSLIFSIQSKLEVIVKFPSLLLKIMPVSKEKAEEQGSSAVFKAMAKDIEAVLPKVRKYYLKTFE